MLPLRPSPVRRTGKVAASDLARSGGRAVRALVHRTRGPVAPTASRRVPPPGGSGRGGLARPRGGHPRTGRSRTRAGARPPSAARLGRGGARCLGFRVASGAGRWVPGRPVAGGGTRGRRQAPEGGRRPARRRRRARPCRDRLAGGQGAGSRGAVLRDARPQVVGRPRPAGCSRGPAVRRRRAGGCRVRPAGRQLAAAESRRSARAAAAVADGRGRRPALVAGPCRDAGGGRSRRGRPVRGVGVRGHRRLHASAPSRGRTPSSTWPCTRLRREVTGSSGSPICARRWVPLRESPTGAWSATPRNGGARRPLST